MNPSIASCRSRTLGRTIRLGAPLLLLVIGVGALIGCFEIPATHALQVNGHRRPEHLISDKNDEPIVLRETNLVDALLILKPVTRTDHYMGSLGPAVRFGEEPFTWELTPDGRHAAVRYAMRTSTRVWPLCFAAEPVGEDRKILLTLDAQGTILSRTSYDPETEHPDGSRDLLPAFGQPADTFNGLDPATRQRLIDAGLLLTSAEQVQERRDRGMLADRLPPTPRERPATTTTTTQEGTRIE